MRGAGDNVGNTTLVTGEEELLVNYLRSRYLANTNAQSASVEPRNTLYVRYGKRLLDIAISSAAIVVFAPINLSLAVCTLADVGRPILYRQTRAGKDGKPFVIVKFRNMRDVYDKDGRMLPPKDRVTKFGTFVRKTSLDELLNFWSVFKGDMSIIGPRPLPVVFSDRMSQRHRLRTSVKPGLECPRVLPNDSDQCQYQNQFENDIWYVENVSFATDVRMLIMLFRMAFSVRKRSAAAQGSGYFAGYDKNGIATTLNRFKRMYPEEWNQLTSCRKQQEEQCACFRPNA